MVISNINIDCSWRENNGEACEINSNKFFHYACRELMLFIEEASQSSLG